MEMIVRPPLPQDADAMARLSRQLGYPGTPNQIAERLAAMDEQGGHIVFVAILDQEPIGWIHVFKAIRMESDAFCEIGGLVVEEQHRGKGIGKILVEKGHAWARDQGIDRLRVRSNVVRTEAHRFYTGLGFSFLKDQAVFELRG